MGLAYALRKLMAIITFENIFRDMISMCGLSHSRFLIRTTGNDPSMCWWVTRLGFQMLAKTPAAQKEQLPPAACFTVLCGSLGVHTVAHVWACGRALVPHTGPHVPAAAIVKQALWVLETTSNGAAIWGGSCSPRHGSLMTQHDGKTILRSSFVKRSKPIIPTS